jgi:hypothetical protein
MTAMQSVHQDYMPCKSKVHVALLMTQINRAQFTVIMTNVQVRRGGVEGNLKRAPAREKIGVKG